MTQDDLSLAQFLDRAYARALPARKFVKLLQARIGDKSPERVENELSAALVPHLLPSPPSLLLSYLAQLLTSTYTPTAYNTEGISSSAPDPRPILTSRTCLYHVLFYISEHDLPPINSLLSLASILLATPTGLEEGSLIPSTLPNPADLLVSLSDPNNALTTTDPGTGIGIGLGVGTSASASASAAPSRMNSPSRRSQRSTLSLLLPLLRICAISPHAQPQIQIQPQTQSPISGLVARVVANLSPFPAPSLDVGLEAGQLLPSLPDDIGGPLRNTLSDLMADLSTHDIQPSHAHGHEHGHGGGLGNGDVDMLDNTSDQGVEERVPPLRPTLVFLIEHARRMSKWEKTSSNLSDTANPTHSTSTSSSTPIEGLRRILDIAPYLTKDPNIFLVNLFEIPLIDLVESESKQQTSSTSVVAESSSWNFVVEGIVGLIGWWKVHSNDRFPFPEDIATPLSTVFQNLSPQMQSFSESISLRYTTIVQQSEAEDESSSFNPLEGWQILSLQETLVTRFVQLGVLTLEQASSVAPGVNVHTFQPGESLPNRLAAESYPHLPPLVHLIQYAYGASTSFASEFVQTIKLCPETQPPENLFCHVASQPHLIGSLTGHITPTSLVDLLVKHLVDATVIESARIDDPQGSLTRFGEGIVLVEAVVAHFKLPLPPLLQDARRAVNFSHLPPSEKECMNGWVKAIFGSDGIEDQILLATSPQALYRLAPILIQQAIAATAANQIDLDTLHSGLSYFSQPLLSWCLGAVVGWLCREIRRQGLLSALHLVVLQDLILGHTCPEALLRVNSEALHEVLDPSSGLGPVFESSGFDAMGIRAKLGSVSLHVPSNIPQNTSIQAALQVARQLELAPPSWERSLLLAIETYLSTRGGAKTAKELLDECMIPSTAIGDSLIALVPIILSLPLGRDCVPLIGAVIRSWLPTIFGPASGVTISSLPNRGGVVSWIIRRAIAISSSAERRGSTREQASVLEEMVDDLIDEVEYEFTRPVSRNENSDQTGNLSGKQTQASGQAPGQDRGQNQNGKASSKKRRLASGESLSESQREVLEVLTRGLRDDEQLRAEFEKLGRVERLL